MWPYGQFNLIIIINIIREFLNLACFMSLFRVLIDSTVVNGCIYRFNFNLYRVVAYIIPWYKKLNNIYATIIFRWQPIYNNT